MTTRAEILKMLSDGAFHSGTDLGQALGVTRAAVCKNIGQLTQSGLDVHRVSGRGYKLETPLQLLDATRILKHLGTAAADFRKRLHIVDRVDSTNQFLSEHIAPIKSVNGEVCLTEAQWAGRGRRGRQWIATPYSNLMLSMAWRFHSGPGMISGLSLVAGLAVLRALEEYGVKEAGLKWPNDLLWQGRKLAGLLVDAQGEATGPTTVIVGVGINSSISAVDAALIDQPWVDLRTILGAPADRNRLAALVLRQLWQRFQTFADKGFAPFRMEWQRHHIHQGQRVRLLQGDGEITGTTEGVDENGALLLRSADGKLCVFHSGEVSLRSAK